MTDARHDEQDSPAAFSRPSRADASAEEAREFKALYRKVYGVELSDAEATEKATKLLNLFEVIWRPLPKDSDKA